MQFTNEKIDGQIKVVKSPQSQSVYADGRAHYTYTVTNPGTTPSVAVSDDKCASVSLDSKGGDASPATLDPGDTVARLRAPAQPGHQTALGEDPARHADLDPVGRRRMLGGRPLRETRTLTAVRPQDRGAPLLPTGLHRYVREIMTESAAVTLSTPAADKLREVLAAQRAFPDTAGLRVGVVSGGCSGFQYHLSLDVADDGDRVFTQDELRILVDSDSLRYVQGSEITFVEEGERIGFIVENPRAVSRCGCGSSFVLRDDA